MTFTAEEIEIAKQAQKEVLASDHDTLKAVYMAGEIMMSLELKEKVDEAYNQAITDALDECEKVRFAVAVIDTVKEQIQKLKK